jgi:hypothetical protein
LDELGGVQGTREIADQAGLNYQQTYRQLGRDTLIEKAGPGRWRIKEKK